MENKITKNWYKVLQQEFDKPYFKSLKAKTNQAYSNHLCLPKTTEVFNAFNFCDFEQLKVVILGQDPYPTPGHAHGLCFSVTENVNPLPKSLINIFKEIKSDLNIEPPKNGNLERWAKQGVFLLNTVLTVQAGIPNSHKDFGWQFFTNEVIKTISYHKKNVVFLLWGGQAKQKIKLIDTSKHKILTSGHPSPLSANRGFWFGNKHFSQTNTYLKSKGLKEIIW
ncbi:MAG TPA: uracil-DNA glycosylase [Crocinitomix sp.]|nr:uracil-DNA glycosylase [Crocinitomix sp.]